MPDEDKEPFVPLDEDLTLKIFEFMLNSRMKQQQEMEKKIEEQVAEEELSAMMILQEIKTVDEMYFQFEVDFNHFQASIKFYADNNESFEAKMIEKEEEVMNKAI